MNKPLKKNIKGGMKKKVKIAAEGAAVGIVPHLTTAVTKIASTKGLMNAIQGIGSVIGAIPPAAVAPAILIATKKLLDDQKGGKKLNRKRISGGRTRRSRVSRRRVSGGRKRRSRNSRKRMSGGKKRSRRRSRRRV
tara:strand:+ start:159 stop:566 length:408 start_codon:yes stop_codon:yes gene_type:complete